MNKLRCIAIDTQYALFLPVGSYVSETEYRVIRNITDNRFIAPLYVMYNNKDSLIYPLDNCFSLSKNVDKFNMHDWKKIVLNIFDLIDIIESNGFLSVLNLYLDWDYVFFNEEDRTPVVIYIPSQDDSIYSDVKEFTNSLRLFIRNFAEQVGILDSSTKAVFADAGSDIARMRASVECFSPLSIDRVNSKNSKSGFLPGFLSRASSKLKMNNSEVPTIIVQSGVTEILDEGPRGIVLSHQDTRIVVQQKDFIIGKQKDSVDYAITFARTISRIHCKISFDNGVSTIVDLGSSNGTFVNDKRLAKDEIVCINPGDTVRLADVKFEVDKL